MIDWYNRNPDELRPIELAAILHHRFVHIHPFHDGNGRVGRLLMNLGLMHSGYPIAMILRVDRKKYYDTLRRADNGDSVPFVNFVAMAVERSLDIYLRSIQPTTEEDRLMTLGERLWNGGAGSISLKRNLMQYKGLTEDEAQDEIAEMLMEKLTIFNPDVAAVMGADFDKECGMQDALSQMKEGLQKPQTLSGQERLQGEVQTPLGMEMGTESNRGARRPPARFTR